MNRWGVMLLLAIGVALALRLPELDRRPMHNDEAVNAVKFGELWERGAYQYDPHEYHGPTLHYLTAGFLRLTGAPEFQQLSEIRLRLFTVLIGVLLVAAVWLLRDGLGQPGTVAAAGFTAVSPALVFYSRYWIHEGLLVLFTFLTIAALWRWWRQPSWFWATLAGVAGGLMWATKETFVFNLFAAGVGLALSYVWGRRVAGASIGKKIPVAQLAWAAGLGVAVAAALFTSFGRNPAGWLDSFRTYLPWFSRAAGETPHLQPWWFYLERMFWFQRGTGPLWTEGLILLLALVGAGAAFRRKVSLAGDARLVRFLTGYTVALTILYALIPYKTPWCMLGFLHGFILLAGVGVGVVWQWARTVPVRLGLVTLLLALGLIQLGWQAWQASQKFSSARTNPWVYSQTSLDLLTLVEEVRAIAATGQGAATEIHVVTQGGDYWPLPWYLRGFKRVGYWEAMPEQTSAAVLITSAGMAMPTNGPSTHVAAGYFQLRPQVFLELHVERGLWEAHLKQ